MLEDYLKSSSDPPVIPQQPSPARRTSKPRPANLPVQMVKIQEQIETIDLSSPPAPVKSRKPPVPPRPAPRKRVKGILKNRHEIPEHPNPIEARVEPSFLPRGHHHGASVRETRRKSGKVSGYQSEMDPNQKCCSKRLRRTRSTDLVR